MSTFAEMQDKLKMLQFKHSVLRHLVEYADGNFLASAGMEPKKTLLTDDKIPIPQNAFDEVVSDLVSLTQKLEADIKSILEVNVGQAVEAAPKKSKKKESPQAVPAPQGESK